jgi:hypothetical protein
MLNNEITQCAVAVKRRQKHSAYISPTSKYTGEHIDRDDRLYYNRIRESSENLRRAIVRCHGARII